MSNRIFFATVAVNFSLVASALGGGATITIYNLPPNLVPRPDTDEIRVFVTDLENGLNLKVLQNDGKDFPSDQYIRSQGGNPIGLKIVGNNFAFTLPKKGGVAEATFIKITFSAVERARRSFRHESLRYDPSSRPSHHSRRPGSSSGFRCRCADPGVSGRDV